jgi:hypothetical protein
MFIKEEEKNKINMTTAYSYQKCVLLPALMFSE